MTPEDYAGAQPEPLWPAIEGLTVPALTALGVVLLVLSMLLIAGWWDR